MAAFLADRIIYELHNEEAAFDALKLAEEQIVYITKRKK